MFKKSLILVALGAALAGCGGDTTDELNKNSRGSIAISGGDIIAGTTLSATLTDPDGIQQDSVILAWSVGSVGGNFTVVGTDDTYTITEADEGSVILVSAQYSDNAGFSEGVGAQTEEVSPTLDVLASVVKGPVSGASCDIFEVSDSGAASTTSQATATTDDTGSVTLVGVNFEGPGLISCSGGTYLDEATGDILDAPTLRSVVDIIEVIPDPDALPDPIVAPIYIVTPLTEMAVIAAGDDLSAFSDESEAINARFGIRFDTTDVAPTSVGIDALGADGAEDADLYGSVLALLSQLDADDTDTDMSTLLSDLVADLDDGEFTDANLDAFELAQANLETTSSVADDIDSDIFVGIGAAVGYNNEPVTAILGGDLSGTVQNTSTLPLTGTVTIDDPNFEEAAIVAQTDVVLDYGTFSITEEGAWTYSVDTANDTVAALEVGDSVSDSITVESIDGTTAEISLRVAALTQVVQISDTGSDTGEIRFSVDNLRQGKLNASFSKTDALGSDGNRKDAYITLYGTSGSSSESLIDLRIQGTQTDADGMVIDPRFFVRNTDSDDYPGDIIVAPFVEEQFYDVEITWDLDATEQLTVTIDGEVIGGGSFSTAAVVDSDFTDLDQWFADGVRTIQFRFGDNDRTIPFGNYFVDNIEVFSDTAGTTSVFADDFESYDEGTLESDSYSLIVYSEVVVFDAGDGTADPTPAVFFDLVGAVTSDATVPVTGAVSVLDPDEGEAFIVEGAIVTTFGNFSILEDGSWTYTLDTNNATIAALVSGTRETDTITIESIDGTTAELVITINGVGGDTGGANNVAVVRDTLDSDTGELRYALGGDGPLAAGRIEVSIKRQDDALGDGDAFITLFNENTNNDGAILDLRVRDDSFGVRSPEGLDTSAGVVILDQFMDIVVTWEYPGGDLAVNPVVNVEVDGVALTSAAFTPDNDSIGGVTHVAFRLGDNSRVLPDTGTLTIDDLFIFSDTAGTSEVFSDDFESYITGDSLDDDNAASPYNSSTSEAVVETEGEVGGPGTSGNKIAEIRDTDGSDTGELRYALGDDGPLSAGRVELAIKRLDDDLGDGDAFITLFNSETNNAGSIIDLRVRDDSFGLRSPEGLDTSAGVVVLDQFMDVVITWEYPSGDLTVNPVVNVEIDGVALTAAEFTPDNDSVGGVTHVAVRFGDNSRVIPDTGVVSVDNLVVYSDVAGTTEVFSDDFEGYIDGDSLDDDNAASPYNSSTSEATVAVEE